MNELRRMRPLLGTFVEVGARAPAVTTAIDAAFASIERAQARWSFHDIESELSRLNNAPNTCVVLHPQTLRLLRISKLLMQRSEGAFDFTVGGQLVLKGVLPDHGGPSPLPRGIADDIEFGWEFDEEFGKGLVKGWARLRRPIRITLDGIAKGFAIDCAIHALRCNGAVAGWINAGGDLRVFGDLALPVQRRELDGRLTSLGSLRKAAMASSRVAPTNTTSTNTNTSEDDEENASFPSCIVAPAGQQPETGIWTVMARSAWRADALTKVAATVSASQRHAVIAQLGGCLIDAPLTLRMAA